MRKMIYSLLIILPALLAKAGPGLETFNSQFRLLPRPQKIVLNPGSGISPSVLKGVMLRNNIQRPVQYGLLASLPVLDKAGPGVLTLELTKQGPAASREEGYEITIGNDQARISASTGAGLFYGGQTLSQMLEDAVEQKINIPSCTITDYPDLAFRAIHLDMKHHVEAGNYYYQIIDRLAKLKINAIIVEFEDKLRYRKSPLVGSGDAISIEEFSAISSYAKARNIEISPLVQGLGHASFILKHEEYKNLRDDPESDWAFDPLNPETYRLQFSLYEDAIEATPYGKYLHVGGDEVGNLGLSELARKSGLSPIQLQMQWLNKVCEFAKAHNRVPIFWDDMVFKLAGLYQTTWDPEVPKSFTDSIWKANARKMEDNFSLFPANCIYMRWNYDAPDIPGNHYAIDWYQVHHLNVFGATAAQETWPMLPRDHSNFQPVKDFCRISISKKMDGLLCTAWDDASPHFETYWRGFSQFAFFSWHFSDLSGNEMQTIFRHRFYGAAASGSSFEFQDQLEQALPFWETALLKKGHRHNYPDSILLIDLPKPGEPGSWTNAYKSRLVEAGKEILRYAEIKTRILKTRSVATRNDYAISVMKQINEFQVYPSRLLLLLEKYDQAGSGAKGAAKEEIKKLISSFPDLRRKLEEVYSITRILNNPEGYLLDQNQHRHLANGTRNDDWMFVYELEMNKRLGAWLEQ